MYDYSSYGYKSWYYIHRDMFKAKTHQLNTKWLTASVNKSFDAVS